MKINIGKCDQGKSFMGQLADIKYPAKVEFENRLPIPIVVSEANIKLAPAASKDGKSICTGKMKSADEFQQILSTLAQLSFLREKELGFVVSVEDAAEEPKPDKLPLNIIDGALAEPVGNGKSKPAKGKGDS